MTRRWIGEGPAFEIDWGGRAWTLRVDGDRPGLVADDGGIGPLLAMAGAAEPGRWDAEAVSGRTLVEVERRLGRVEATYRPKDWGDLTVRAAWSPVGEDGLGLEVQLSALSVGRLRAVEVLVESGLPGRAPEGSSRFVEPRDARSAALSYDGREPDLSRLTTLPPRALTSALGRLPIDPVWDDREAGGAGPPEPRPDKARLFYAEFVHPQDATRRITWGGGSARATRYGLFGYDLEKGVILRARLRGLWLPDDSPRESARARFAEFLREPPPLMT